MKWFGEPWPSASERAPVCEDDADRIAIPVGEPCCRCTLQFSVRSRGLRMPSVSSNPADADHVDIHLACFMSTLLPPEMIDCDIIANHNADVATMTKLGAEHG